MTDAPPHPVILSLRAGLPREVDAGGGDGGGRAWRTGSFKDAVDGLVRLGRTGLEGDGQADLRVHGGPDKALCAYPAAHYPHWRRELGRGEDSFAFGAFGENVTVGGAAEADVCIGDVFAVGTARVEVSQPRQPCWKLARRWESPDLALRVRQTGFTGWYFRVREEGELRSGLPLVLLERPYPEWTVARANEVMEDVRAHLKAAAALALCPALSSAWKLSLAKHLVVPG